MARGVRGEKTQSSLQTNGKCEQETKENNPFQRLWEENVNTARRITSKENKTGQYVFLT
jgi:hypothetical protein